MIQLLQDGEEILKPVEMANTKAFRDEIQSALWIDLFNPEPAEEKILEEVLQFEIPSQEEMHEISESSRLFIEKEALYMSCWVLSFESAIPLNTSVTFVSTPRHFISIRYSDHHAFRIFTAARKRLQRRRFHSPGAVQVELLEALVGHIASTLRLIEQDLNSLSLRIFAEQKQQQKTKPYVGLKQIVQRLGKRNSLVASLRESSVSLSSLTPFLRENAKEWLKPDLILRLKTLEKDILSLREYDSQLSSEINFLQDSTVGLISIDQNQSMKILSIAAVVLALI